MNYIRSAGLQLNINPIYTSTHNEFTSFEEWKAAAIPVWDEIAKRYKPDTLVIIRLRSLQAEIPRGAATSGLIGP